MKLPRLTDEQWAIITNLPNLSPATLTPKEHNCINDFRKEIATLPDIAAFFHHVSPVKTVMVVRGPDTLKSMDFSMIPEDLTVTIKTINEKGFDIYSLIFESKETLVTSSLLKIRKVQLEKIIPFLKDAFTH